MVAFDYRLLRPEVLLASVLWEDTDAITQAKTFLANYLLKNTTVPANLREVCDFFFTFVEPTCEMNEFIFTGHLHRSRFVW